MDVNLYTIISVMCHLIKNVFLLTLVLRSDTFFLYQINEK